MDSRFSYLLRYFIEAYIQAIKYKVNFQMIHTPFSVMIGIGMQIKKYIL